MAAQKDEKSLFITLKTYSADDISQALNQLFVANFNSKIDKRRGKVSPEHKGIQKKLMLFLKNKRSNESKDDFNSVTELDDCVEEFLLEINDAKEELGTCNVKGGVQNVSYARAASRVKGI